MESNLFRYIWKHTRKEQLWILGVILLSMPVYFLSLDLPKRIVNSPIQGEGFATPDATQPFMAFTFGLPDFLGGASWMFPGFDLERLPYLVALSLTFLGLVCVNGLFKFYINTYKGRLGERMLRRMRYELVDRVLRFPYNHFRRLRAPEVATMVKDEVEPLGGFIGEAYVSPVFLGGQALTAMAFILAQSYTLGLIAGGIVLVQALLIPRLRRRLLQLGKARQLAARELAGRVGEIVDGIADIRTNDTSNYERAGIANRLSRIFFIRYEFYQRKFFVKFLNNFLAQVTPFLFYLIGGYFAIRGSLDIGQLVAVIAAYKDLPTPVRELIDWDQRRLDIEIKYGQVVEQFAPDGMVEAERQVPVSETPPSLTEPIVVESLLMMDDTGGKLVEDASFKITPGERIAAVGDVNSGGEAVAEALARLYPPATGRVLMNNQPIEELSEAITGRRISYIDHEPNLHNVSLLDCLLYGLKHVPDETIEGRPTFSRTELHEAKVSGNTTLHIHQDWIDYRAAGCDGPGDLRRRMFNVLKLVGLDRDIFDLGLRGGINADDHEDWSQRILEARAAMRETLQQPEHQGLIEPFDPEKYNNQMTVAGNLTFGRAVKPSYEPDALPSNPFFRDLLGKSGLDSRLFDMGTRIAATLVELFADLEPDNPFLEELTFMTPDELPTYKTRIARESNQRFETANAEDRAAFLRLALAYNEPQHRLSLLDDPLRNEILAGRKAIFEELPATDSDAVLFYDPEVFNSAASLQDNIFFGRAAYGVANSAERLREAFGSILDELDMNDLVFEAGLEFMVGTGGRRLTTTQRQKIGLARGLLKRPDLLVVNRGLNALSSREQTEILKRVLEESTRNDHQAGFATFWVLMNPANATYFDRVLVFENGRLAGNGTPDELMENDGLLARMIH
ncbi:MAG: ABC transporter transmembrane domain-containing protein [Hyphomicrobiaceae bacterium]